MPERGVPKALLRPVVHCAARYVFSPRVDWLTTRRRLERTLAWPGPPRGVTVRPVAVGGVPGEEHRTPGGDDATLLYFHGGGYVVGSARGMRSLIGRLALAFGGRALAVDYRLAPEHPYPAALQDARAVWAALRDEDDAEPRRIVLAGDSAGAGIALALTLALRDAGKPLPAALGLISPWLDLTLDLAGRRPPAPRDVVLTRGLLRAFALAACGETPPDDPSLSPLHADLSGLPPVVIQTASEDLLRPDGEKFVVRARAAGVAVTHEALEGYWHDAQVSAALLGEPAGGAPLRMAGALRAQVPVRRRSARQD